MTKSSEQIEQEIDGIRERMRGRINRAADELSPKAMASRLVGKDDPSMTDMLDWAMTTARNNPVATSLIAAGLASFALQSDSRVRDATRREVAQGSRKLRGYAGEATETAKGYLHDAADIAVETADEAAHYVRETAERATRTITRSAHDAEDAVRYATDRSVELGRDGAEWVKRNPTATGLFALAIGAATASYFAARRNDDVILRNAAAGAAGAHGVEEAMEDAAAQTRAKARRVATKAKTKVAEATSSAPAKRSQPKAATRKSAPKAAATPSTKAASADTATATPSTKNDNNSDTQIH
jgi:hypothetical protein